MAVTITTYGERTAQTPAALEAFAFLVGKWTGTGRTRLPDGNYAPWEGATCIGRYVLNGLAIADEFHSMMPDGKPYLGISLRHYEAQRGAWIIEYLNVTHSFLRRQVNPQSGSVSVSADSVVVISEDGETRLRERYRVVDPKHFTYSLDQSSDAGRSWGPALIEMTMTRVE